MRRTEHSILVGIALIGLLVGGLSVVNTMAMSIAERTREIEIKRAIGGSRTRTVVLGKCWSPALQTRRRRGTESSSTRRFGWRVGLTDDQTSDRACRP
jgi:hypothetical protein